MQLRGFRHHLLGVASCGSVPCQSKVFSTIQLLLKLHEKGVYKQLHWAVGSCVVMLLFPYFFSFTLWGVSSRVSEIEDWAIRSFASSRLMEASSVWLEHLRVPCKLLDCNICVNVSSWILKKLQMTVKSHWRLHIFHVIFIHSMYIKRRRAFLIVRIEKK